MRLHIASTTWRTWLCLLAATVCGPTFAQSLLLDSVHTVATATTGVPVEHDFQVAGAGTYTITLSDLGALAVAPISPVPLASLKMALTSNDVLVGTPVVVEGTGSSSTGAGVLTFTATAAGSYRLHVIGAPASGKPSGPISIQVVNTTLNSTIESWSDLIALPAQAVPSTSAVVSDSFQVTAAGTYQISLNDLALPQALGTLTMIVIDPVSGTDYILPDPTNNGALQKTVTLSATTYQVYVVAQVASGATGGLFSATVSPGAGAPIYAKAVPVGSTVQVGLPEQLATGTYSLTLTDLGFPAALASLQEVLVSGGQTVAVAPAAGGAAVTEFGSGESGTFPVGTAATYQLFAAATAQTTAPAAGSYTSQITLQGGAVVLTGTQAVVDPSSSSTAYPFTATIPSAGSYTATLTDFQTPAALATADFVVVQNGAIVGTPLTAAGTVTSSLAAGPVTMLAILQGGSGGSIVDVNLASAAGSTVFDQPQGVGLVLAPTQISITTGGTYQFTLGDLQWPAPFSTLAGIITSGPTLVGRIYGGGTLNAVKATPGNYYVNIIATPGASSTNPDNAGTYVLNVSSAPPAPTVNLSANSTSVSSGSMVTLTWTTTNATSCVASGGNWSGTFTGAQAASDSATSPAVTGSTTFTLTCTGAGGTTAGTVTVSIASSSSKSGGGALDPTLLLLLAGIVALNYRGTRKL